MRPEQPDAEPLIHRDPRIPHFDYIPVTRLRERKHDDPQFGLRKMEIRWQGQEALEDFPQVGQGPVVRLASSNLVWMDGVSAETDEDATVDSERGLEIVVDSGRGGGFHFKRWFSLRP